MDHFQCDLLILNQSYTPLKHFIGDHHRSTDLQFHFDKMSDCPETYNTQNGIHFLTCHCGQYDYTGETRSHLWIRLSSHHFHANRLIHGARRGEPNTIHNCTDKRIRKRRENIEWHSINIRCRVPQPFNSFWIFILNNGHSFRWTSLKPSDTINRWTVGFLSEENVYSDDTLKKSCLWRQDSRSSTLEHLRFLPTNASFALCHSRSNQSEYAQSSLSLVEQRADWSRYLVCLISSSIHVGSILIPSLFACLNTLFYAQSCWISGCRIVFISLLCMFS